MLLSLCATNLIVCCLVRFVCVYRPCPPSFQPRVKLVGTPSSSLNASVSVDSTGGGFNLYFSSFGTVTNATHVVPFTIACLECDYMVELNQVFAVGTGPSLSQSVEASYRITRVGARMPTAPVRSTTLPPTPVRPTLCLHAGLLASIGWFSQFAHDVAPRSFPVDVKFSVMHAMPYSQHSLLCLGTVLLHQVLFCARGIG